MTDEPTVTTLSNWTKAATQEIADEAGMQALGQAFAETLHTGAVIFLRGDLGSGKSVLARAIIHALGYAGRVRSPTYALVETYDVSAGQSPLDSIAHLDLYRLQDPAELDYLGFDEICEMNQLVLIEWPEKGGDRLPLADLVITIDYAPNMARLVSFSNDRGSSQADP